MKEMTVKLNKLDIMILTDLIIEASKKSTSETTLEMNLELIEKIQKPLKG